MNPGQGKHRQDSGSELYKERLGLGRFVLFWGVDPNPPIRAVTTCFGINGRKKEGGANFLFKKTLLIY